MSNVTPVSATTKANAPYSRRAPSPPFIPIIRNNPMDLNQQPMRIVPTFDGLDPGTLTEEDLQIITNNDAQIADDRSAMWTYKMRHEAQRILDFLYLGPRTIVKDAQWLNATGITMIVLAHDVGFGPLLKGFAEKCTEGLDIETLLIPVASSHGLTKLFDDITRAINQNLLSVYRQQAAGAGDSQGTMAINSSNVKRGKVLVTCQTGNDRATVIAAAYIMSVFGVGMVDAVNFITSQRFCSNFDEEAKRALCSWEEILGARKDVHRARTPVGSERGGSGAGPGGAHSGFAPPPSGGKKRRIEDTRDDDDMDMGDASVDENMDSDRYLGRNMSQGIPGDPIQLSPMASSRRDDEGDLIDLDSDIEPGGSLTQGPRSTHEASSCKCNINAEKREASRELREDLARVGHEGKESATTNPPSDAVIHDRSPSPDEDYFDFFALRFDTKEPRHSPQNSNLAMKKGTILSSSAANATTVPTRASDPTSHFTGKDITVDAPARDFNDSGDNEDKYRLTSAPTPARKISERKRIDAATFETWLQKEENSKTVKKQRMEVRERAGRGPKGDDRLTTAALVKLGQSQRIVDSPREYQVELFEKAREMNTIIVLDTGSGKTLIAMLLLRYTIERELERRAAELAPKISCFVVDKVALVDQQWSALVANLPYPVARLFGREVEGKWTAQFWRKTFEENKVIVCTAAVLQRALSHSFISMKQINLLIIDEAHHAKKNHPYARIVIDYYLREKELQDRPRILGMTASPVDGKADILASAKHLESLLQSRIATVSSGRLGDEMGIKVHEEVVQEYKKLEKRYDTRLSQSLKPLIKWNPMFQKHAAFSTLCTYDLGPWCTDRFWKRCFGDGEMGQLLARAEAVSQQTYGQIPFLPEGKDAVGVIHELREIVRDSPLPPLKKTALDLSYKVLRLLTTLEDYFAKPSDHKCIIFTERRRTAVMLADVCEQLRDLFPALQVGFLVGAGADLNLAGMTYHEAVCTIHKFKTGEINCLFASSIAEEGIDIPDCDIIIRFDLCNSMIQYIQSRGRARHQESKFINMVEESNHAHLVKLKQISRDTRILRDFCSKLPESRRLDMGPERTADWKGDSGFESFTVEETGATLTFTQSLVVLDSFAASFQEPGGPIISPQYAVMKNGNVWVAQVNLPENLPIQYKRGREQNSKQAAKCSAAFEMCLDLIKRQFIDGHLQPYMKKRLPAMRNARLAVSANKTAQYNMRLKPSLWDKLGRPKRLFGVALTLETPEAVGRASCPLILLSRRKLPDLPDVPLFFGAGKKSVAQMIPLKGSYGLSKPHSDGDLEKIVNFTLRIFKDVFNKAFEATAKEMPYFLAPSRFSHATVYYLKPHIRDTIHWEVIQTVVKNEKLELAKGSDPGLFYHERYITDPYCGSRSFYSIQYRPDLAPSDPIPEGVPPPKIRKWDSYEHNIKEWSISLWSRTRDSIKWKMDQPVVEVELVSLRRNMLDDFEDDDKPVVCYVIMQPLQVSALPVTVVSMAFAFPALMHRIDSVLIALEAGSKLGLQIWPDLALEAVTKDSNNSEENGEEQVIFQTGIGKNYERLEFLGDAFLKMATSIALFTQCPDKDEFAYHVERMLLICNKNMFNTAVDMGLQEYIRSKSFNRRTWYPTGLRLLKGKAGLVTDGHSLSDKSIADVCEAFIGAAYLSSVKKRPGRGGTWEPNFDMAVKAVTAVVRNKRHKMEQWSDYHAAYTMPDWQAAEPTPTQVEGAKMVGAKVGYEFRYPALLRSAFKHPSYPYEKIPNYQRLEFLGDALLDMVCVDFLFGRFPEADPQWLTEHKMAMVSSQFLGCLCVELGLHRHMLSIHAALQSSIQAYVEELEKAQQKHTAAAGGEQGRDRSFWLEAPHPPKCLPDMVEAYVGAAFVDSGYDYGTVQEFFERQVRPYFEDMTLYDSFANRHPVTYMASRLAREYGCKEWRVLVREDAPDAEEAGAGCVTGTEMAAGVLVHGKVFAAARAGASGRHAKMAAARAALEALDELGREEFRARFGCDCRLEGGEVRGDAAMTGDNGTAA